MRGADALIAALEAAGVDTVFGMPGGANLPLYDALLDSGIRHVLMRHEAGAGHAAEGYARATGRVGVAFATSGPGATNLVTPICDAQMDSIPTLFVTGQVRTALRGTNAFQEADVIGITAPIVKHSIAVERPDDVAQAIADALHLATAGRPGPVLVDVPVDVANGPARAQAHAPQLPGYRPRAKPNGKQIRLAAQALAAARRPVLYAGGGVVHAGAAAELTALARLTGAPVTTTLMALGAFPASAATRSGRSRSTCPASTGAPSARPFRIREAIPNAAICFDPFHVVRLAARATDQVRRDEWIRHERSHTPAGRWIKGTRWSLLKAPENQTVGQLATLWEVQQANRELYRAFMLREELRLLYHLPDPALAPAHLDAWLTWASRSRLKPFVRLARTLREPPRRHPRRHRARPLKRPPRRPQQQDPPDQPPRLRLPQRRSPDRARAPQLRRRPAHAPSMTSPPNQQERRTASTRRGPIPTVAASASRWLRALGRCQRPWRRAARRPQSVGRPSRRTVAR
jgi:hypothetical protein